MKNYKTILIWAAAVLAIVGSLIYLGAASAPSTATTQATNVSSRIVASEDSFDFGTVSMAKGSVTHAFTVRNSGSEPIAISRMYTSCMCTTATLIVSGRRIGPVGMQGHGLVPSLSETLIPGAEATVEATFDPAAHGPAGIGAIERAVILENNGAGGPLTLRFKAVVTP